jgi:hypothetical protein
VYTASAAAFALLIATVPGAAIAGAVCGALEDDGVCAPAIWVVKPATRVSAMVASKLRTNVPAAKGNIFFIWFFVFSVKGNIFLVRARCKCFCAIRSEPVGSVWRAQ